MVRPNPRKPKRGASIEAVEFEAVEFEALLDPVDVPPQVAEPVNDAPEPAEPPEPAAEPEQAVEVPPEGALQHMPASRFDAAGTDDDRLPVRSKRTRRHR